MKLSLKICSVILLVLLLLAAAGSAVDLVQPPQEHPVMPRVLGIFELLAIVSALYYTFRGYSKYAAPAYKAYMIICAVYFQCIATNNSIISNMHVQNQVTVALLTATNSLLFGMFLLLGIAKDMGKKLTYTICTIVVALTAFGVIASLIWNKAEVEPNVIHLLVNRGVIRFLLGAVAFFMAGFKYYDKAQRGTK